MTQEMRTYRRDDDDDDDETTTTTTDCSTDCKRPPAARKAKRPLQFPVSELVDPLSGSPTATFGSFRPPVWPAHRPTGFPFRGDYRNHLRSPGATEGQRDGREPHRAREKTVLAALHRTIAAVLHPHSRSYTSGGPVRLFRRFPLTARSGHPRRRRSRYAVRVRPDREPCRALGPGTADSREAK